jgi:hypothetical protein
LELALLAAVVAGLFGAKLIVDVRSHISLGAGVSMPGSGLTVHLPQQNNWRALNEWQYERNNSFVLPAQLISRAGPMNVNWRYYLNTTAQDSRQALEQVAAQMEGRLYSPGRTAGDCPMEYARILTQNNEIELYVGAVVLDFGRVLILQVQAEMGDLSSAKTVFDILVNSIRYEKPAELTRGEELLQKLRQFETTTLFADITRQNLLARDASGSIRGYETIRNEVDAHGRLQINKKTVSRLTPAVAHRKEHLLESTHPFETFDWRCQNDTDSESPGIFCLRLKNDGNLTIETPAGKTQTCRPGPVIVSALLLDVIVRVFLEAQQQNIVLDVLYDDGRIIPTQIAAIPLAEARAKAREMAFAVRLESPGGLATEFYFAADKSSLGKMTIDYNRKAVLWEPTEQKEIDTYFNTASAAKGPMAKIQMQNFVSYKGII